MARFARIHKVELTDDERLKLVRIANSRKLPARHITRAKVLLAVADNLTVLDIRAHLGVSVSMVQDTVAKALAHGVMKALDDLPRSGKPAKITPEATEWLVSLACTKPTQHGYPHELWTERLLSEHARKRCVEAGHPSLGHIVPSTVHKILAKREIKPHRIQYYLENRDPDFDGKMAQVLCVYRDVVMYRVAGMPKDVCAVVAYDEKPGVQAIGNTAPDLLPVPGKHPSICRDHEYVRYGTVTLLAALDLVDGTISGIVRDRHRTLEFIELLDVLDERYPKGAKIRVVLDNHSAHTSKQLQGYLAGKPDRFEFIFTPKHGSWLNIIESFFAKMANTMLRGIRVNSKQELVERIEKFLTMVNSDPVIFKWKYQPEEAAI